MIKADLSLPVRRALGAAVAGSALALAAAACGGSSGNHPAGPSRPPMSTGSEQGAAYKGATYKGTIYVSSQVFDKPNSWHVTKTFTEQIKNVGDCAAAAKGDGSGVFQVPSPKAPLPEDSIKVKGFHGPGTYPPSALKRDKLDTILVPGKSGLKQYDITASGRGRKPGKEALFLNPNGSGQLVYSEAHLNGMAAGPAVAGMISWTCTS
jgi:hypothetical protein